MTGGGVDHDDAGQPSPSGGITIRLLGDFSVTIDGTVISTEDFDRRSGWELVQLLSLAPKGRRHREQVLDALWPEVSFERAANRLYQAASHARKALGSQDAITIRDQIVALFPNRVFEVDVATVERADPNNAASRLSGLTAWGGELLPHLPYAEWTMEQRDRVRHKYVQLLEAAGMWEKVVEIDPEHEGARVALANQARQPLIVSGGASMQAFVAVHIDGPSPVTPQSYDSVAEVFADRGGTIRELALTGTVAAFASAVDAVAAAVAIQRRVADGTYQVAIDMGEVESVGSWWAGGAVDRVEAVASVVPGGQIICTSLVASLQAAALVDEVRTVDLGLYRLPGWPPLGLHRVDVDGLETRETPLRTSRVAGRPIAALDHATFGRSEEIEAIEHQLDAARLITMVGPGGVGKTHLACHVGSRRAGDYRGGAWLSELAKVADADGARQQILMSIGGHHHTDATVTESIFRTIADRSTLLVLDNCEHLLEPVGELCEQLLEHCPEVRIMATSREPLGTRNEALFRLGELDRLAAIELFTAEAARHDAVLDTNDPSVARICERLDDQPLAIRLAAARSAALDVEAIETMLSHRLTFSATSEGSDDGPDHHQSLRSAIDWSVNALDDGELGVLIDLSAFADRFTLDGAVAVAGRHGLTTGEVLTHFDSLTRRSLVSGPDWSGDHGGYRLIESVRLYARELVDAGAGDRHLAYFVDRVEASAALERYQSDLSHHRIRSDWDDIRKAAHHGVQTGRVGEAIRLLAAAASYATEGIRFEYLDWCQEVELAHRPITGPAHARAMAALAFLTGSRGDLDDARRIAASALEVNSEDDLVLWANGWVAIFGDTSRDVASHYLRELVADRQAKAGTWRSSALVVLVIFDLVAGADPTPWLEQLDDLAEGGAVYDACRHLGLGRSTMADDPATSLRHFEAALAMAERHDLQNCLAGAHSAIPTVAAPLDAVTEALRAIGHSLRWFAGSGQWTLAMTVTPSVAAVLERVGRDDTATTILAARRASQLARGVNYPEHDEQTDRLRDRNPRLFEVWSMTGERLDPAAATALALAAIDAALLTM